MELVAVVVDLMMILMNQFVAAAAVVVVVVVVLVVDLQQVFVEVALQRLVAEVELVCEYVVHLHVILVYDMLDKSADVETMIEDNFYEIYDHMAAF